MKITLFTSNQPRHNYFINLLSKNCKELFVIQESKTLFPGLLPSNYNISKKLEEYFKHVKKSEKKIFGLPYINSKNKKLILNPLAVGDLNKCSTKMLKNFLQSDLYIVFGSSYIKGGLASFLCKKNALNIHMGVSPYYRGTDCNFWAMHDGNSNLVGATIHLLSKGLDSGPMLYHAMSKKTKNPFDYTMLAVKSALDSIVKNIKNKKIKKFKKVLQSNKFLIRYSKKKDFTDKAINNFFLKVKKLKYQKIDKNLLKDPFFLK